MQTVATKLSLPVGDILRDITQGCVLIVRGGEAILALQPLLIAFSEHCGQAGAMQDLVYFLGKPGLMKRIPYLFLLVRDDTKKRDRLAPEDLLGALLMLEYRVLRFGTRAFATNDRSGRGTLLSTPQDRLRVATLFCDVLVKRGANILMLSVAVEDPSAVVVDEPMICRHWEQSRLGVSWTLRQRTYPSYLKLDSTLDGTLAHLGQKTRSNMRYYRRRAEKDLGCYPVTHVELSEKELLRLNDECMFPVSRSTALWRLRTLRSMQEPFLVGMKDRGGRWLSVVAGRRCNQTSEILWQLNRAEYPAHSLGTVMRSYLMEMEIARGSRRLQVEGGTSHTMGHSFVQEQIVDMVIVRSRYKHLMERWLKRFLLTDNLLAQLLRSPEEATWRHA